MASASYIDGEEGGRRLLSEKLETETYRVASWLQARANALLKRKRDAPKESAESEDAAEGEASTADAPDAEEPETEQTTPARKLRRDDIVAFALSSGGDYGARYTLGDLVQERKGKAKDEFQDELVGKILVVDARLSGLKDGILDAASDGFPDTADGSTEWSTEAQFRVRRATSDDYESKKEDWRFEDDFVLRSDVNGDPEEWLVVEHYKSAAQSEDARSVSRPQELGKHQSWAEQRAQKIAAKVGLSGTAAKALALAASLHDEGKKAERWQRAFRAPREKDERGMYKIFAKTSGPINQAILDGYRHEFGSLPHVEENAEFKALPEAWRDLVLHLVAAHHGGARPLISTQGCEDAPPSALEDRARDVALRFARLQKDLGTVGSCMVGSAPARSRPGGFARQRSERKGARSAYGENLMAEASIPVDLINPGQVFACLGLMEAAEILCGPCEGRFDYRGSDSAAHFALSVNGSQDPVSEALRFLLRAEAKAIAPLDSDLSTKKWDVETLQCDDAVFPCAVPESPAALPMLLTDRELSIPIEHWADGSGRDNVKFWAGAAGYPGAALARDGLNLVRNLGDNELAVAAADPFNVSAPQSSSFRFDWRRDYIPLDAGFSPNEHGGVEMVGYPFVELLAAIGMQHARPARVDARNKLVYRYGVSSSMLPTVFARAVLGGQNLGFPVRVFRMRLGWPGQEGQARCIIDAQEELVA